NPRRLLIWTPRDLHACPNTPVCRSKACHVRAKVARALGCAFRWPTSLPATTTFNATYLVLLSEVGAHLAESAR
ncbi:hypothetical protein, partial [Xanthomonas vasicola]|uniref:hypothetical protein n=1 Tax=Xanthomonas vasicola TaxID=56459 RepID=UPI001FEEFB7F